MEQLSWFFWCVSLVLQPIGWPAFGTVLGTMKLSMRIKTQYEMKAGSTN
ncbi:hypothetical protein NXF25_003225 [Crotalus adamanteus]|uniref:Uncharacterized protein n=1 Tax=Crotalus adamanteus TaxID=8729 RepID=A0AAW1CE85_CROAD